MRPTRSSSRTVTRIGVSMSPCCMDGAFSMADELDEIATQTLAHYSRLGEGFRETTRDHDVSQNIDALLNAIRAPKPFTILDVGCGPGRDLGNFAALGHTAIGLEGCAEFAAMAREGGAGEWEQDF